LRFFEIEIKPLSGFGTPIKGDTLFGHFCWQADHDPTLLNGGLVKQIKLYKKKPFAIFSSAFPKIMDESKEYYGLKTPKMPMNMLFQADKNRVENLHQAKENKKKKWMLVEKNSDIDPNNVEFITEKQLCEKITGKDIEQFELTASQQHNSINRMTGTTGQNQFAPYLKERTYYIPETMLSVFILVDEEASDIKRVVKGLERIGSWGFGKDASTGSGRFSVNHFDELKINIEGEAFYTLAPSVPTEKQIQKYFLSTFTRFGKHGDKLACSNNPFKSPVIMADESSVFVMKDKRLERPYIGNSITGVSKVMPETVVQGYSPCLPIKLE